MKNKYVLCKTIGTDYFMYLPLEYARELLQHEIKEEDIVELTGEELRKLEYEESI